MVPLVVPRVRPSAPCTGIQSLVPHSRGTAGCDSNLLAPQANALLAEPSPRRTLFVSAASLPDRPKLGCS